MHTEFVLKVDTTKTTVQWRFAINSIYDYSALYVLKGEKAIFLSSQNNFKVIVVCMFVCA